MHSRDEPFGVRKLCSGEEEIGREHEVVIVEYPQERFDASAQREDCRSDRQEKPFRDLVRAQTHVPGPWGFGGCWFVRGEEGVAVEVELDAVITFVEFAEQMPFIPANTGLVLEQRKNVDADNNNVSSIDFRWSIIMG